ncbi:structure-specific recognition protein-domain-containing protein [Vararia minispora EC-137]|uniref:Structure-specific recognition protein-domain-containing protein n=1 Tax=Vararia minispora EC-137 TaxID=1314806 RepID=A0ACB8QY03_9AGAM|nr:structure-specific recognition protein-domain-containing protein [Vararia minispora EC-137]
MSTQFDGIYHGFFNQPGRFRIASSGMAWRSESVEGKDQNMPADNIKWAQWLRVARGYQLRIGLKDRSRETFDGFEREDQEKITSVIKQHFGVTLEVTEVSFKGWNWGETDFRGQDLAFLVSNKLAFELPLNNVNNSNIAGRTEVSLEFHPSSKKAAKGQPDEMVEIRFFVPGQATKARGSDAGSDAEVEEDDEVTAAQAFHDAVKEKAELGQATGSMIISFEEVLVTTPRGRYDVDMFPEFLRLRGKTYDYKIAYQSISKLFLLPKDDLRILFVLGLSMPIRQGQTRYQYLVMEFNREEETTAELNMSEEDIAKHERLKKNYEDPTFEVVSSIFRALSGKKIISGGSFVSRNGQPGLKAHLKAVPGELFLLDKYIFFVSKQPVLVDLSDVHQVLFSRVGGSATSNRTFDMRVVTRSGPEHTFSSINKEEYDPIETYLKEKKVRLKNEMAVDAEMMLAAVGDDSDEEMQSVASDDDVAPRVRRMGDDDDDSEEGVLAFLASSDDDFQASSSDGGSPTESDSDSDGAETASDASGDLSMPVKAKGKGKEKEKEATKAKAPAKKAKADDEDDKPKKAAPKPKPKQKKTDDGNVMEVDDEPEDKPKPKPKPKPKAAPKAREGEESEPAKKKQKKSAD